ncbi:MAG: TolC family protein [Bacteroidales bacterium]|nr:TolC family protein [Bacteroidales bacterium]
MRKKMILAAAWACFSIHAPAQELYLSLEEIFQQAESSNADLRASQARAAVAKQGIDVARSARLPEITADLTLNYLGDGTILDRDFSNAMRDKLPHFGNSLALDVYQPLFTGGAISGGIKMAEQQYALAGIGVDMERSGMRFSLVQSYLNLFKMRNLERVYVENIAVTNQLLESMRARHEQGTVLKNDITRYELRLSSLNYDLTSIRNSLSILNRDLTSMLSLSPDTRIVPDSALLLTPLPDQGESYWLDLASANNHEFKAVDAQKEIANTALRLTRAERFPAIGLIARDQISGPVTFEIPAINKNYNYWLVGVNVSYKLSSLFKTNKAEKKQHLDITQIAEQRTAVTDALERKIHEAYTLYLQAQEMLATEQKNVELATENYRIVDTRFRNDIALLTDMLDASTAKLDAETRLVNARINTLISLFQLKYISGTL